MARIKQADVITPSWAGGMSWGQGTQASGALPGGLQDFDISDDAKFGGYLEGLTDIGKGVAPVGDSTSFNPANYVSDGKGGVTINLGSKDAKPEGVNWATGLTALTGIGNLALGKGQLALGKEKYASSLDQYTTNLSNQAQTVNNQIRNEHVNRLVASGQAPRNPDGTIDYTRTNELADQYTKERGVSGQLIKA